MPDRDGLPEVRGRARRLRTLHRDLPEDVALRRQRRRAARGAVAAVRAPPALGSRARDARSLTSPAGRTGRSPVRPAPLDDLRILPTPALHNEIGPSCPGAVTTTPRSRRCM